MSQDRPSSIEELTLPASLDLPAVRTAVDEWLAYRRANRHKAWVVQTWKLQFRNFDGRPDDFVAAVEHSISQGYQGLFEPRRRPEPKRDLKDLVTNGW